MSRLIAGRLVSAVALRSSGLNSLAHAACKRLELRNAGVERYPNLERKAGTPDLLAEIARPRAAGATR